MAPVETVYRAEVVTYFNHGIHAEESKLTGSSTEDASNPGYAGIKYIEVDGPGNGEGGQCNVFRWADNATDPPNKNFTQAHKDANPNDDTNFDNAVFDTAAVAERGESYARDHGAVAGLRI